MREENDAYRAVTWQERSFNLLQGGGEGVDGFGYSVSSAELLARWSMRAGSPDRFDYVINRWSLPEGSPGLIERQCGAMHDLLVFTNSRLGAGFYSASTRKHRSFYQLESDYFYPGHTMSGIGRLFDVPGPRCIPWLATRA